MVFDKEYFEGKNYKTYKDKYNILRDIYFPLAIINEEIKPPAKILDVGCAYGYFLKCCDEYRLETYGVDISEYAINEAKKITNAKLFLHDINSGLSIFEDNSFDIITAFDIIEHLTSPYNSLKEFGRILNKHGKLVMNAPNILALERIINKENWHGFKDKTHIYLFTPASLKFLVVRSGFDVIRLTTPFLPLPKLIQKIANKTGLGGQIWLVAKKK